MRARLLSLVSVLLLAACGAPEEPIGTAEDEQKVCAGPQTLEGVDVSHWQNTVDWAKVKTSGRAFAIFKATEGTTYVDPQFATNWSETKAKGLVRGAYHFFHADIDPIAQADHFLQTMGALEVGDLPPTLDLETTNNQSDATITSNAIAFLDHVADATGTKPILYTSPSFITNLGNEPIAKELDQHATLWIANWGVSCPDVPAPYTTWVFWQYDDATTVPGIAGSNDVDQFNGTMADLMALTVQPASSSSSSSSSSSTTSSSSSSSSGAGGAGGEASTSSASSSSGATTTTTTGAGGDGGGSSMGAGDKSGCGCAVPGREDGGARGAAAAIALAGLLASARRRRRANVS